MVPHSRSRCHSLDRGSSSSNCSQNSKSSFILRHAAPIILWHSVYVSMSISRSVKLCTMYKRIRDNFLTDRSERPINFFSRHRDIHLHHAHPSSGRSNSVCSQNSLSSFILFHAAYISL